MLQVQCKQFIKQLQDFHDILKMKYSDFDEIEVGMWFNRTSSP